VAAAGVYVGALGKIARDVSLLMQPEVGEVFESGGGSSTMPHKRNPSGCVAVLACAHRIPGLVAAMLGSMVHEHERSVGSWQAEGATLVDVVQASAAAVSALAGLTENLTVDRARMGHNIDATGGVVFAEQVTLMLAPEVGRLRAAELVRAAVDAAAASGRRFADVVAETPELSALIARGQHDGLFAAESYLGSAGVFRARLLAAAGAPGSRKH